MKTRLLSIFTAIILIFAGLPISSLAADTQEKNGEIVLSNNLELSSVTYKYSTTADTGYIDLTVNVAGPSKAESIWFVGSEAKEYSDEMINDALNTLIPEWKEAIIEQPIIFTPPYSIGIRFSTDKANEGKDLYVVLAGLTKNFSLVGYSLVKVHVGGVTESAFSDVSASDYFAEAVSWAKDKGITNGTGDGKFEPQSTVTRSQAVTFLWRAMGCPEPTKTTSGFSDVEDDQWYSKAIIWAAEKGITNGTGDNKFSPTLTLSRSQLITLIWRTLGEPGEKIDGAWYATAEHWARGAGLLDGTGETYKSEADCPRCDVVYYLFRELA